MFGVRYKRVVPCSVVSLQPRSSAKIKTTLSGLDDDSAAAQSNWIGVRHTNIISKKIEYETERR